MAENKLGAAFMPTPENNMALVAADPNKILEILPPPVQLERLSPLETAFQPREDVPSVHSCQLLADYSGIPLQKVLKITGQLPEMVIKEAQDWPEFREYAREKYPNILDEDIITLVEDLIERRRDNQFRKKRKKA